MIEGVMHGMLVEVNWLDIFLIIIGVREGLVVLVDGVHGNVTVLTTSVVLVIVRLLLVGLRGVMGLHVVLLNLLNQIFDSLDFVSHDSSILQGLLEILLLTSDSGCLCLLVLLGGSNMGLFLDLTLLLDQGLVSVVSVIGMVIAVVDSGRLVLFLLLVVQRDDFDVAGRIQRDLVDGLVRALATWNALFVMKGSLFDREIELSGSPVSVNIVAKGVNLMFVVVLETVVEATVVLVLSRPEVSI
jgi:hypothetical protein